MSRHLLMRAGGRAVITSLVLTVVFAVGSATGIYLYPRLMAAEDHDHEHDSGASSTDELQHHADEEEDEHIALTKQAYANLGLQMGTVTRGDYWKTQLVPARVVEIPGRSDLSVSAPVTGVVEYVSLLPGQSLAPREALFTIRLTDEELINAQSKLLETLTRQEVVNQEIARLRPLIDSGAVSGVKVRELEYELKQIRAQQSTLLQELRSRGLPQSIISGVMDDRVLASTLTVYPPSYVALQEDGSEQTSGFSVEDLLVHPGKSVSRGEPLCTVAYHSKLYLEGTAFEDDFPILDRIAEYGWKVTAEAHGESHHHAHPFHLDLLRVDNHVDEETQTVKFFLELSNEVTRTREANGQRFEQWRFRPGQRLHLRLPVEQWKSQLTLPVDAVVIDGPSVLVFAEHQPEELRSTLTSTSVVSPMVADPDIPEREHDGDDHHDVFLELEPIEVRLLHRDDKTVVIADDGQIPSDARIALNHAYKLYLAMKVQSGGGGGHHHHH